MNKTYLLETFSQLCGTSEFEPSDIRNFLQMKQYRDMQDPTKFLIVGGRGAGKTRVFRTLVGENGFLRVIGDEVPFNRPNYANTKILEGYSADNRDFPTQKVLETFKNDEETIGFWAGSIVLVILNAFRSDNQIQQLASQTFGKEEFDVLSSLNALKQPSKWMKHYQNNLETWANFLDEVDEILYQRNQWVIIAYDQIDRISTNYDILYSYIRTLIAYWFSVSTRWRRLKCKIFIRTDLIKAERMHFPDASKIVSRKIDLSWDTLSLYRLLIRRIANTDVHSDEMLQYLSDIPNLIQENESIGYVPTNDVNQIKKLITKMIGPYMGSSPKKGDSFSWVPNHLQDANGDLAPRAFLKCFACAAQTMLKPENERILLQLNSDLLMNPSSIQGAVQEVSEDRVEELTEDFPWLANLKSALEGGALWMPLADFQDRLGIFLKSNDKKDIPADSVDKLMQLLIELGIIIQGSDSRINMPEIYLHGFGLKRKGGLRRPK